MASFLVTKRMRPELKARVQASVEGRRATAGGSLAPRAVSLLRFAIFVLVVATVASVSVARHRSNDKLESDRSALLERLRRHSSALSEAERSSTTRVLAWLARSSGAYEGDFVAEELRRPQGLDHSVARPAVYVRGPLSSFGGPAGIRDSASTFAKDAFVLCLVDPPSAKSEKLVRAKARAAYGGDGMRAAAHVERLKDALIGLPYLTAAWETRVVAAERGELDQLRASFDRAPIESAERAAKASLLVFAMDEPSTTPGPTELDGERPHDVRVGFVDLVLDKLLLRLRRHVDPSWVSDATRAEYASGVDSCVLALDVRAAASGA